MDLICDERDVEGGEVVGGKFPEKPTLDERVEIIIG